MKALEDLYNATKELDDECAYDGDGHYDRWQSWELQDVLQQAREVLGKT